MPIDPRINPASVAVHARVAIRATREAASEAWDNREEELSRAFNEAANGMEAAIAAWEKRSAARAALAAAVDRALEARAAIWVAMPAPCRWGPP